MKTKAFSDDLLAECSRELFDSDRDDDDYNSHKNEKLFLKNRAKDLLRSPDFFYRFVADIRREGLVGEKRGALTLYVGGTSRLRPQPVNVMVKGESSAGKNYLTRKVIGFFPENVVHEVSSMSPHALNFFSKDELAHSILYFYEIDRARSAHPNRLLISEGKLIHWHSRSDRGGRKTEETVTAGPVACFSTTTEDALKIDDESRHLSIWIDESPTQTKKIAEAYVAAGRDGLSLQEKIVWKLVQNVLGELTDVQVVLPEWSEKLVELMPIGDVRIRRYWPAFIEAWKTVTLIRSFQSSKSPLKKEPTLTATFEDFATTNLILDRVVSDSLTRSAADEEVWTAELVARIAENGGHPKGVGAVDILDEPGVTSIDKAYRLLRKAERAGTIFRVNRPAKDNAKLFLPSGEGGFLGEPDFVLRRLGLKIQGEFVHPITGKTVSYGDKPKK